MSKDINESAADITHIYHISDLHIRNLQRHKEYRLVFTKFLAQVKKDNIENSVIYLAGDIAHAKTEMSPELVEEISWLLTECAKLRETFLITGNHDCNLNNSHRLDVLTPIVKNLNNPKIHYLRDTGTYPYRNLTFVVYSILDHKDNWANGYEVEGENKICCFHGPVNKAETDIGYTVASNSFSVQMFDGFDMAVLGDIHKRQCLQEFTESTLEIAAGDWELYKSKGWKQVNEYLDTLNMIVYKKQPAVAYSSSLLQQNHGELLEKHGYLLWNVATRTYEEFDIHNDFGYLTIDVVDGVIPQWVYDEIDTKLPKYPRLRLRFTNTAAADMALCITELKQLFKSPEVTVTRTDTMGQLKTGSKLNKNIVGDVTDVTFQNQLIREYLERSFALEDSDLNTITDMNLDINSQIDDTKLADNIVWIPKTFQFDNMFSYGEGNKVNFQKSYGIIGLFAANKSGKSSLFDALLYCLFDKSSRTISSKNVLNTRKESFYCKFNFEIDGVDYFIERTAKWTRKKTNLKVDVNFWKVEEGIKISLNGEQRRDTNKHIEQYLGKFEDFILTTLSLQGNNALFIDKSQTERKEILSQFIGVDIFDKLYQTAADENRDNASLMRKFKSDDFTSKLAELTDQLDLSKISYLQASDDLSKSNKLADTLNREYIKLNGTLVNLNSDKVGITELLHRKEILRKRQGELSKNKEKAESRIELVEKEQLKLDDILDGYDEDILTKNVEKLKKLRGHLNIANSEKDKTDIKIQSMESQKEHLEKHKYNPDCDICMENASTIITSKEDVESELLSLNSLQIKISDKILELTNNIDVLSKSADDWEIYNETAIKEEKVDRELSTLINRLSTYETEEVKIGTQIVTQDSLIGEYYKNEVQIKKNQQIRSELKVVNTNLSKAKKESGKFNTEVLRLNGMVSSLENQQKSIQDRIDEVTNLEQQTKLFDFYLNALSKDGISYELIEKALPMLEGEVNNILGQIVDFGIQLDIDGKNINAYLVYGEEKWSLEMSSGMERFISGIAIRVALINICNLPRPNFLVIDEGFGVLDSENLQSLYGLFTYLKTQFDFVMVVSHIDSMRDTVDNLIEIKKVDDFSHIKF